MVSIICSLLFGVFLLVIVYQDFYYRALSVYVLSVALTLIVVYSVLSNGMAQAFTYAGINLLLILLQIGGVFIYFSIKNKAFTNIINTYMGSGDLLFLGVLAFSFSPVNFVLFSLAAYLVILLVFAVLKLAFAYQRSIPLAGCLSILLVIMIALSNVFHIFEPYNDEILSKIILY